MPLKKYSSHYGNSKITSRATRKMTILQTKTQASCRQFGSTCFTPIAKSDCGVFSGYSDLLKLAGLSVALLTATQERGKHFRYGLRRPAFQIQVHLSFIHPGLSEDKWVSHLLAKWVFQTTEKHATREKLSYKMFSLYCFKMENSPKICCLLRDGHRSQDAWIWIPAPTLAHCVTPGKGLNLSVSLRIVPTP